MNWKEYYSERCITLPQAAQKIPSNSQVLFAHAVGEPTAIIDAMLANKEAYENVEVVHMVTYGKAEYCQPGMEKHFWHNSMFLGGSSRAAINEGRGDFTPTYLHQVPKLIKEGLMPVDVFLCQVSPPDEHGYFSLGPSVDYGKAAVEHAKLVIAQVNEAIPHTMGASFVPATDIDYFVECNAPLPEVRRPVITDIERQIGENIAPLIKDGDCLQLGIGSLPDATLLFLKDKKDLGIHSEMISDGVMELIEAGVITCKRKNFFNGKAIVTFFAGTRDFYDFIDYHPMFETMPADFVNDPYNIAQNDNVVSINSCVEVDFYGQVASESVGKRQISGVGGQVDFIRGANMSKGGRAIIAMPSTTKDGRQSKIVPFLKEGTPVSTNRYDVGYIATEYGVAYLRGKTIRDRARALIEIAHPDFRPQLIGEWEQLFKADFGA